MQYVGIALLVLACILLFLQRSQQAKLRAIKSAEPTTVKDVSGLARSVSQELLTLGQSAGRFGQVVSLSGTVVCDSPLTSEVAQELCVYYDTRVEREYEETYRERDPQTEREVEKTRRGSETVSSHSQRVFFRLEDDTGSILVNPEGADVDSVPAVDRFEPAEAAVGATISVGGLTVNLGGITGPGRRTLGYRFREKTLPLGRRVYVLGEASDSSGELTVRKPGEKGGPFIISLKSGEDIARSTASTARWLLYSALASGAVGVVLVVVGLLRR